jgi:hypothetical protein
LFNVRFLALIGRLVDSIVRILLNLLDSWAHWRLVGGHWRWELISWLRWDDREGRWLGKLGNVISIVTTVSTLPLCAVVASAHATFTVFNFSARSSVA